MDRESNNSKKSGVFLTFGYTEFEKFSWKVATYDPQSGMSSSFARMTDRDCPAITSVATKGSIILGGRSEKNKGTLAEVFDYKSKCTFFLPHMNHARWGAGACCVDGNIIICGGFDDEREPIRLCELYQWSIRRWNPLPDMIERRGGVAVVSLSDNRIVAIGGRNERDGAMVSSVEYFHLTADCFSGGNINSLSNIWRSLSPMNQARLAPSAVVVNNKVIVVGGYDKEEYMLGSIEIFTPPTEYLSEGQWILLAIELNQKRNWGTIAYSIDGIYIMGNERYPRNTVERIKNCSLSNDDVELEDCELLPPAALFSRVWCAVSVPKSVFLFDETVCK